MAAGLAISEFWDQTPRLVMIAMEGAIAGQKARNMHQAELVYTLAQLNIYAINDHKKMPTFEEAFPAYAPKRRAQTAEEMMAVMDALARRVNAKNRRTE